MSLKNQCILLLSVFVLLLSACGKEADGVNEISYKKLIKKLDNRESFFLITTDAPKELLKETEGIESYDKALKDYGISAYYVNLSDFSDVEIDELEEKYAHASKGRWFVRDSGLVYVENGGVLDLVSGITFGEGFHESLVKVPGDSSPYTQREANDSVKKTLKMLDKHGVEYENNN